ncbi:MAG: endonuclease domain-containing protein [Hyphomonadaceae bacterium]|nr:endonuclease domain-containing protein [Hyphomonadaceae bacterium]
MSDRSTERARAMRKAMSPPELTLWMQLRAMRSEGWHFRRQSPEGPYILDFVCRRAKLVVEVDGVQHASLQQAQHDRTRDGYLIGKSFRVMRFWASDIESELDGVMQAVRSALGDGNGGLPDIAPPTQHQQSRRYQTLVRMGLRPRKS